jgi:sarcosine oxidase subunit gamma
MIPKEDGSMVDVVQARPVHAGQRFANSAVNIEAVLPASRVSLRVAADSVGKVTRPLGFKLPLLPKTSISKNGRSALWLGPDEWLVIDNDPKNIFGLMGRLGKVDCSAVDISHRNTAILVSGVGVEDLLSSGCLQDLALQSFPVGSCSRTIFGKIEIVLWRLDELTFHIEVWRSFSDYLWDYLLDAARGVCIDQA